MEDFINLFQTETTYEIINQLLKRIAKNKHELLRVLDRPELPLHNNLSEGDIRDYVKKRKISESTRSEKGRRCRDTFASLKKPVENTVFHSGNPSLIEPQRKTKFLPWLKLFRMLPVDYEKLPVFSICA